MHGMMFLFAAVAVVWLALAGYVMSLARRQSRLQLELNELRREWSEHFER